MDSSFDFASIRCGAASRLRVESGLNLCDFSSFIFRESSTSDVAGVAKPYLSFGSLSEELFGRVLHEVISLDEYLFG